MGRILKAIMILALALGAALSAQEPTCAEIHGMAKMAGANSTAQLMGWKPKAGTAYRARVVFALRFFELHPTDRSAAFAALDLIPKSREEDGVWHDAGALLCEAEPVKDMMALGKLGDRLPRDLAKAALLVPGRMFDYVSYAYTSCGDPHSDYALRMQRVCRARHLEFQNAVNHLSADDKKWFLSQTFNPETCRALCFPEAD